MSFNDTCSKRSASPNGTLKALSPVLLIVLDAEAEFGQIKARVLLRGKIGDRVKKIDRVMARESVDVKAIRVYTGKLMKEIDSSTERGENPHIYIQRTYNEKRRLPEIQIVLMGEHHIEPLSYFTCDPRKWSSFGAIVLSLEGAEQFVDKLKKVAPGPGAEEEILKAMTIEMPARKAERTIITFWKPRASLIGLLKQGGTAGGWIGWVIRCPRFLSILSVLRNIGIPPSS